MATQNPLRSKTVRFARTAATVALALILIARAVETGSSPLTDTAIAALLFRLFFLAMNSGHMPLDGKARLPRRFPLSQVVSTELRGRKLVLRTIVGRTASVPYTSAPGDAELVAKLREGLAATGVVLPDPAEPAPARNQAARLALIVATVIVVSAVAFVVAVEITASADGTPSRPQPLAVTTAAFAARDGTFTDPFFHVAACPAYVVPLDVDSYGPAHFVIAAMHTPIYEGPGGGCVTHPLKLSPAVVDPDRHQLNTHLVMDDLRAAYVRAHGETPARVIGLTEFDLFSPSAPGEAFVTIDEAVYGSQTFGVGSSARGRNLSDFESIGRSLSG